MTLDDLLNRRIPLAIVAALCVQAGGIVWWAATHDADAHFQQHRIDHLEQTANDASASQTEILERLARIEERVTDETETLKRIDQQLNRSRR